MPVKIDMDMPKVCANCPLYKKPEDEDEYNKRDKGGL